MPPRKRDTSLGHGVYYRPEDYLGITWRLVVYVVDGFVLLCLLAAFLFMAPEQWEEGIWWGCLLIIWVYGVVLKPTRLRTVGYRVAGCRIVNLKGERPSIFRMTFRSLLWIIGPFNLLVDISWCVADDDRQTLRDRFAGTCVIKQDAQPLGAGEIHLTRFSALGYALSYPAVVHPRGSKPAPADDTG